MPSNVAGVAIVLIVGVGTAMCLSSARAADLAAFERDIAEFAHDVPGDNPISYLGQLGEYYCQMKQQQGGTASGLDKDAVIAAFRSTHPRPGSAGTRIAEGATIESAKKYICPG